jgi:UDP-glucose 4-epimerase
MTLDHSVNLILHAFEYGESGSTWIPKLPSMKIGDLAEIFAETYNKSIEIIGPRPGEKMHEDLINQSESVRVQKIRSKTDDYYVIKPIMSQYSHQQFTYTSSDDIFTKTQLKDHLTMLSII